MSHMLNPQSLPPGRLFITNSQNFWILHTTLHFFPEKSFHMTTANLNNQNQFSSKEAWNGFISAHPKLFEQIHHHHLELTLLILPFRFVMLYSQV
jgi:hypothetical protein